MMQSFFALIDHFMIPGEDCCGDPVNVACKLGEDLARRGEFIAFSVAYA